MDGKKNLMKEIPDDHIQFLLDDLKSDFPNSIHAWSFLRTIRKWKAGDPTFSTKILALNGDYRTKFIVYFIKHQNAPGVFGSFHKWSHVEDDEQDAREALRNCHEFPWFADGKVQISGLTEETNRVVESVVRNKWDEKGLSYTYETGDYVNWISKEDAVTTEIVVPNGTYIANLTEDHIEEVNKLWPHRYNGSLRLIESFIKFNLGIGIFDLDTRELMAWAFQVYHGGVGALQTKEHHKRKGYGSIVLGIVSREIAKRDYDPHLIILPENMASRKLTEKANYQLAFRCSWVTKF